MTDDDAAEASAYRLGYGEGRRALDEATFNHYRSSDDESSVPSRVDSIVAGIVRRQAGKLGIPPSMVDSGAIRAGVLDAIEGRQPAW